MGVSLDMRPKSVILASTMMVALLIGSLPAAGSSEPIGELRTPRSGHSATKLWGGSILVIGGERGSEGRPARRAELVDPDTGRVRVAGVMPFGVSGHTVVALPDRRALVVGGRARSHKGCGYPALLWHGSTKRFTRVGSLPDVSGATATKLRDGRILIAGGGTVCDDRGVKRDATRRALIWDPTTGRATATGRLTVARSGHRAIGLTDGRVLVVGGHACVRESPDATGCALHEAVEVWDPADGTWRRVGRAPVLARTDLSRLHDGTVVLTGTVTYGTSPDDDRNGIWTWDPDLGDFVPATAQPRVVPDGHVPVTLGDGRLAMVGGERAGAHGQAVDRVRIWAPRTDRWITGRRPGPAVFGGHTATRIGRAVILIGGSVTSQDGRRAIGRVTRWLPDQP